MRKKLAKKARIDLSHDSMAWEFFEKFEGRENVVKISPRMGNRAYHICCSDKKFAQEWCDGLKAILGPGKKKTKKGKKKA